MGNMGDDTLIQRNYTTSASLMFPWEGLGPWCNNANTTVQDIASGYSVETTSVASRIVKYQIPFVLQFPLDGYGPCLSWGNNVITEFPSLKTYNGSTGQFSNNKFIRVDNLNFSKQVYNDLINLYYNLRSANSQLPNYWYGVTISSIGSDFGGYPNPGKPLHYMMGNESIKGFAQSSICVNTATTCAGLIGQSIVSATSDINSNHRNQWENFTNSAFYLGVAYALHNFTNNYLGGRSFIVAESRTSRVLVPSNQYPAPYNTTYIKNLELINNHVVSANAYVENGNPPTQQTFGQDQIKCLANSYGNNLGGFLASTSSPYIPQYIRNMMYLVPYCVGKSFMEPGNIQYSDAVQEFRLVQNFGTIMNRMSNYGNIRYVTPAITASDSSTSATLISPGGKLLVWFYTNKTSVETASITLNATKYGISSSGWVAINALDWSVVNASTTATIKLTVSINPKSWAPIYVMNRTTTNLDFQYTNVVVSSKSLGSVKSTYTMTGPHHYSSWLILRSNNKPTSISSNTTGSLTQYSTLASLNTTTIGYINAGSWQNLTQTGWFYDSTNNLLYIHFRSGSPTLLTIQNISIIICSIGEKIIKVEREGEFLKVEYEKGDFNE